MAMRRHLECALLASAWLASAPAQAADEARCRELDRKFELGKAEITSVETNALLFSAAGMGCTDAARRLLAGGASLLARDRLGAMPLAHAARAGQAPMVALLLEHGAPIDARNLAGST